MLQPFTLITGATTGIGWELAKIFAHHGNNLILVARNEERLRQREAELRSTSNVMVKIVPMDLSRCGSGEALYHRVQENQWVVDTLVNNAGFGLVGHFLETDPERERDMVHLNVLALQDLCKLFARDFKRRGEGKILNVASTAAYLPGPRMAVYYATKAYVLSLSEALYYELRPYGITVTALAPGPTRTEFQARAGVDGLKVTKFLVMMSAAAVARAGYQGLIKGKRVVIPGLLNKLSVYSMKWLPRSVSARMVYWLQK